MTISQLRTGLMKQIDRTEVYLLPELSPVPDGFNFGLNDGEAAGQTVVQFHLHIIPRYRRDVSDPLGGIRGIIPAKAPCWKDGLAFHILAIPCTAEYGLQKKPSTGASNRFEF